MSLGRIACYVLSFCSLWTVCGRTSATKNSSSFKIRVSQHLWRLQDFSGVSLLRAWGSLNLRHSDQTVGVGGGPDRICVPRRSSTEPKRTFSYSMISCRLAPMIFFWLVPSFLSFFLSFFLPPFLPFLEDPSDSSRWVQVAREASWNIRTTISFAIVADN